MPISSLFCQGRPDVDANQLYSPETYDDKLPIDEKRPHATDEDEMQERLSDLRREISDAKVDW